MGDIRHKGMVMGIELIQNKKTKKSYASDLSTNKTIFEEVRKHQIYFRTTWKYHNARSSISDISKRS